VNFENLKTVRQIAECNPAFTEASLRWLIYRADQNGIDQVLVRVGRRILFDMERFEHWLERRRQSPIDLEEGTSGSSGRRPRSYAGR
jgi:hypothetical protein